MAGPEPIPGFDLYAELRISPSSTPAAIDAAWRSLVKRHHPDAQPSASDAGAAAANRIRRLNVAHDWLSDPNRRARYDRERVLRADATWRRSSRPAASTPAYTGPRAPARAAGGDRPGVPPEYRRVPPEWSRVPPATGPELRSLIGSRAFAVALVIIVAVIAVGGALTLFGALTGPSPVSDEGPLSGEGDRTADPDPSRGLDEANALAATIPDQVDGVVLLGESGPGVDLFGADAAGVDELVSRVGGRSDDVRAAYKGGTTPDGEEFLTVIALTVEPVAGADLAAEFRQMTDEDPEAGVSWSDGTAGGRTVAISRDVEDLETVSYLLSSTDAMYLVVASDGVLADEAIRSLP